MHRMLLAAILVSSCVEPTWLAAQDADAPAPEHGAAPSSIAVRNVRVVRGDGTPAYGPTTVFIEDGVIVEDGRGGGRSMESVAASVDGSGCTLMPGLVSTHAHIQTRTAGMAMPREYQLSLWLASGITAIRDNGSSERLAVQFEKERKEGTLGAPRVFRYKMFGAADTAADAIARVEAFAAQGVDGIKFWSNYAYPPEVVEAAIPKAHELGLYCTAHIGVGESNALTYSNAGLDSIEHWYGVPDAALAEGVQNFPSDFSYSNEVHRFRYAGRLWREVDQTKLGDVLEQLVRNDTAWSPTFAVYEASRDLTRAQNLPWFEDYLHPALNQFFSPNRAYHGSYFMGWSTTDEVFWKENYRIWMAAVKRFADLGGMVTTGEDAGYIYTLYGFGLVRELELHQEAGFHPLQVISHATYNGAKVLRQEQVFGRVANGLRADLIVVRGNVLENLKCLYPTGTDVVNESGQVEETGGVLWTMVDGRCWHGPTLAAKVRQIVTDARAEAGK